MASLSDLIKVPYYHAAFYALYCTGGSSPIAYLIVFLTCVLLCDPCKIVGMKVEILLILIAFLGVLEQYVE